MKTQFKVNVGRRNRYFDTLKDAVDFVGEVFKKTGIILSIVVVK